MGREKKGREAACPNNKKSFPRPWPVNNGEEEKKGEEERRGEGWEGCVMAVTVRWTPVAYIRQ